MSIKGFKFDGVVHKYDYNSLDNIPDLNTETDKTLAIDGVPADAKATGDRISNLQSLVGSPLTASTAASMIDTNKVYVYTGSETGYTNGNWYYHDGTSWVSGGVYNSVAVDLDSTLTLANKAPDSKVVGDAIGSLNEDITNLQTDKQDALTFDQTPTAESTNPVTSGGIKLALDSVDTEIGELKNDLDLVENATVELIYNTDITAESTEQGSYIYKNASTGEYIKATTSATTYWKLTTFPAKPFTKYKAFGAYQKDTPIAVFVDGSGNYIGSTDSHPEGTYQGVRDEIEFSTPASTAKIITNIFSHSYTSTLTEGNYSNILTESFEEINSEVNETNDYLISLGIAPITEWAKGIFYANGSINTAGNGAVSDLILINANTTKYITSSFAQAQILFWNSSNVYIGKIAADGSINKTSGDWKTFTGTFDISEYVPENAAYLRLTLQPTNNYAVTEENVSEWANANIYSDDRIGVLNRDVKECQTNILVIKTVLGDVDLTDTEPGYFNPDGTIHAITDSAEVYMVQYLPVIPGETLTVNIALSASKTQWARWCFYDVDKNVISSGTQAQTWTASLTLQIVVPDYATYIRMSYRTYDMLSSFTITKNDALTVGLIDYCNSIADKIIKYNDNCIFAAHQGYDPASVGTDTGHNKLEGYYLAAEHGFDAGETDVKFTSDDIPVCCHDSSFVDATTGDTVVIANTTYAELITHNYYGGTIASFEDVVKACKTMGMQLIIDQVSIMASEKWPILFNIVKKFGMGDRVFWTLFASHTAFYAAVHAAFPKTGYEFLQTSGVPIADMITYANSIANDKDNIIVGVNYGSTTPTDVASYAETCAPGVKMGVWTIPQYIPTCIQYLPYVAMITTNRTAYNDLWNSGIQNVG